MIYYNIGDIMKNKTAIILLVLGIISLISGGILTFVTNYKEDQAKITKTMNIIVDDYETFRKQVEAFSTSREKIYNEVMNTQYYAEVYSNYNVNVQKLQEYENAVVEIDKVGKKLKESCIGKNYTNQDVVNKCNAFVINYEQSINYFINDINRFNSRIKEYNTWVTSQTETTYKTLTEYDAKYKDYIDINNDKTFSGKAEK